MKEVVRAPLTRAREQRKARLGSGRESWTKQGSTANQLYRRALDATLRECPFDIMMDGLQHVVRHREIGNCARKRHRRTSRRLGLGRYAGDAAPERTTLNRNFFQVCSSGIRTFEGGT